MCWCNRRGILVYFFNSMRANHWFESQIECFCEGLDPMMILRWWKSSWSWCLCSTKDVESRSQTTTQELMTIYLNGNWSSDWALATCACWRRPCADDPYQKKWFDSHKEFSFIPLAWGHEGSQGFGHNGRHFQSRHKLHFNPGDKNDGRTTWKDTIKYIKSLAKDAPFFQFESF